eukprot:g17208.t1
MDVETIKQSATCSAKVEPFLAFTDTSWQEAKLFGFVVRSYDKIEDARAAEASLIAMLRPCWNIVGNNGLHDHEVVTEQEKKQTRKTRRRRPGRHRRTSHVQIPELDDRFLVARKFLTSMRLRKEKFAEMLARRKRETRAEEVDGYAHFDLLSKWLVAQPRRRIDYSRLEQTHPGFQFPLYPLRKAGMRCLKLADRQKFLTRIRTGCNTRGIPSSTRMEFHYSYVNELDVLRYARRSIIYSSHAEVARFLREETQWRFIKILPPRARELYRSSRTAAKRAQFATWFRGPEGEKWDGLDVLPDNFSRELGPISQTALRRNLTKMLSATKRQKKFDLVDFRPRPELICSEVKSLDNLRVEARRVLADAVLIQDDKQKNTGILHSRAKYLRVCCDFLEADDVFQRVYVGSKKAERRAIREMNRDAKERIPRSRQPKKIRRIPAIYFNYKGKCIKNGVRTCEKPAPHQCARKVVVFAGVFREHDRRKFRRVHGRIANLIKKKWTTCEHFGSVREQMELDYEELQLTATGRCAACGCEVKGIYRAIFDAVSFFEQIATDEFYDASSDLRDGESRSLKDDIDTVAGFVGSYRCAQFGVGGHSIYRMRDEMGTPIGGPFSSTVSKITLGRCENRNLHNLRNSNFLARRYEDDIIVMSNHCPRCAETIIRDNYAHPFAREDHNVPEGGADIDPSIPISWQDYETKEVDGRLHISQAVRGDPLRKVPAYSPGDIRYSKVVLQGKLARHHLEEDVKRLASEFVKNGHPAQKVKKFYMSSKFRGKEQKNTNRDAADAGSNDIAGLLSKLVLGAAGSGQAQNGYKGGGGGKGGGKNWNDDRPKMGKFLDSGPRAGDNEKGEMKAQMWPMGEGDRFVSMAIPIKMHETLRLLADDGGMLYSLVVVKRGMVELFQTLADRLHDATPQQLEAVRAVFQQLPGKVTGCMHFGVDYDKLDRPGVQPMKVEEDPDSDSDSSISSSSSDDAKKKKKKTKRPSKGGRMPTSGAASSSSTSFNANNYNYNYQYRQYENEHHADDETGLGMESGLANELDPVTGLPVGERNWTEPHQSSTNQFPLPDPN